MYKKEFCEQYHVGDSVTIAVSEESQVWKTGSKGDKDQNPGSAEIVGFVGHPLKKGCARWSPSQKWPKFAQNWVKIRKFSSKSLIFPQKRCSTGQNGAKTPVGRPK